MYRLNPFPAIARWYRRHERWVEFTVLVLPPLAVAIGALVFIDSDSAVESWAQHLSGKLISAVMAICIVAAIFRLKGVQLERDQLTGRNGVIVYCSLFVGMALIIAFA